MHTLLMLALTAISGVWSAWQYNTGNWDRLAPLLAENGFDTVFYCAAYGPETDIGGLRECVEACRDYGIDVHAWVVMWKTAQSPDSLRAALGSEGRMQEAVDDDPSAETWLCPSRRENVELMASTCLRIAASSPVEGIHLDYIRYSSDRVCFCSYCDTAFGRWLGTGRYRWPEDCYRGGSLHGEYNRFRSETITEAVYAIRDSLGRLNRVVELSAAVLPRERELDYYGQHWDRWLQDGKMDFVVPMNYTVSDSELVFWSEAQLEMAGGTTIPCGLILSEGERLLEADEIAHQVELALETGFQGFVLFHLSRGFTEMLENGELNLLQHGAEPCPRQD